MRPVAAARTRAFAAAAAPPPARRCVGVRAAAAATAEAGSGERLRLHNLSPQKGSRRDDKRKGRGYGGHQGGTCGFGTRGQKARAGSGTRPGFEGGQMPLYRRLPKLRGIAGGAWRFGAGAGAAAQSWKGGARRWRQRGRAAAARRQLEQRARRRSPAANRRSLKSPSPPLLSSPIPSYHPPRARHVGRPRQVRRSQPGRPREGL
jgi:hypothetical protein